MLIICKTIVNVHKHLLDKKTVIKSQIGIVDTRDHLGDLDIDGRIILKGTLSEQS
jgi:hypothetical protein